MSCTVEEDLTAYMDGELPAPRRAEVERHLASCVRCQATHALLSRTVVRMAELPQPSPSPSMRREVLARLEERPTLLERLRSALRPMVVVPSLGLMAAALLAVVLTTRAHHRGVEVTDAAQLELAANLDVVEDYDVLGVSTPEDVEVVEHLQELEKTP